MRFRIQVGIWSVMLAAAISVNPAAAWADSGDHEEARRAVEAGQIRPLTEILRIAQAKLPGKVVRVKIEQEDGLWVYEFRVVDGRGKLFEVYVDARTGEIRRVKEK